MKTRLLLLVIGIHATFLINGQIPEVPARMEFGGMKLSINQSARKEIQKDVNMLRASDKYFRIKLDRALLYFPLVEKAFDDMGVPSDFKYLSIQESALISDVISSSKAVGFWQFKDFTGREVGLRIDNRIDERKNIVAASKGAATYLKRNNRLYDNWIYALTAYYAGPGGASRYVDKSEFGAKTMEINKKTHWYVKRFLAHKIAFENELNAVHSEGLKLITYTKGEGKDLNRVAREFDVETEFLQHYNKWIKYGKIPEDKEYAVIIPVKGKNADKLLARAAKTSSLQNPAQASIEEPQQTPPKQYASELKPGLMDQQAITVKINGSEAIMAGKMDNLNTLAAEGGINPKKFKQYNDMMTNQVTAGQIYYLERKAGRSNIGFHVVRENETMWDISQRYGIRLSKLYRKNRMEEGSSLKEGRVLWLRKRRPKSVAVEYYQLNDKPELIIRKERPLTSTLPEKPIKISPANKEPDDEQSGEEEDELYVSNEHREFSGTQHIVSKGETLWSIAQQYEISIENLRKWNQLTKYDELRINQKLFVEKPELKEYEENRQRVTYVVKPGDTMYRIATKYQMEVTELMNINGKKEASLSIGEELIVYRSN